MRGGYPAGGEAARAGYDREVGRLQRVLIANRGEIAIRIARAADALRMTSVAVYADVDERALHTRLASEAVRIGGPGDAIAAYLDIDAVVRAAVDSRCDCVHPGYGFLAENAAFASACAAAGLTFVGPSPEVLALFGDKIRARALATEVGVPVVAGSAGAVASVEAARAAAAAIGYPVMLKAAAGGGGRGIRLVESDA